MLVTRPYGSALMGVDVTGAIHSLDPFKLGDMDSYEAVEEALGTILDFSLRKLIYLQDDCSWSRSSLPKIYTTASSKGCLKTCLTLPRLVVDNVQESYRIRDVTLPPGDSVACRIGIRRLWKPVCSRSVSENWMVGNATYKSRRSSLLLKNEES
jgi:hypothetical protein